MALKAFLILIQVLSAFGMCLSLNLVSQAPAKAFPCFLDILLRKTMVLTVLEYLSSCRVK